MAIILNGSNTPTAGGVGYGDGSNLAFTGAGTSGQVLTSAGTGTPTWTTPSAGAMTLISTQTITTNTAKVSFTGISGYRRYLILFDGMKSTTNSDYLEANIGYGSTTWITSGCQIYLNYDANYGASSSNTADISGFGNGSPASYTTGTCSGNFILEGFATGCMPVVFGNYMVANTSGTYNKGTGYGIYPSTSNVMTAFRIAYSSGNISQGTFSLYGISS